MPSCGTQSGASASKTATGDTDIPNDDESLSSPSTETTQASQALEKADHAKLFMKRSPGPSDMFTAISSTTRTLVFPEYQAGQDLPLLTWSPLSPYHKSADDAFLEALNRCPGEDIKPDDLKTFTMVAAPSGGANSTWWECVKQKYGSITIVIDEGIKQEVSREEVGVQLQQPYARRYLSEWAYSNVTPIGYIVGPYENSTCEFKCWVVEA